jgi:hypothetical protein
MATVSFVANHVPAPACYPADYNALLDGLTTGGGISGTVPDNAGGGIFVGSSPPGSSLTNKVWYKVDGAGRPIGVYMFYNGNWRKVYSGVSLGEIRMWSGSWDGVFDGTGRGVIGGDLDGWAVCNGQNGTPNLEAMFIVGGSPGQQVGQGANVWYSDVEGDAWRHSGGAKGRHTIARTDLPKLLAEVHANVGGAGGTGAYTPAGQTLPLIAYWNVVDGNGVAVDGVNQQPLPMVPYYAVGYIEFVGYL